MLIKKIQIGKLLLEQHLISQEQLDQAIIYHNKTGAKLGQALIDLKLISEEKLLTLLSEQLDIPYINLHEYTLDPTVSILLPEFYARRFRCILLKITGEEALIGMSDPQDVLAHDELVRILKKPIRIAIVRESDLLKTIDTLYRHTTEISSLAGELSEEIGKNDYDLSRLYVGTTDSDAPVVKLLQTIFNDAVQVNASDIHIEPDEKFLRIRQRIDGVLHEQIIKEKHVAQALTLRLKIMAQLNIAEKRLPQDGRFSIKVKEKNFDVRLSTLPIEFGESVVMRLLNQSSELVSLDHLGLPEAMLQRVRQIISLPSGILLITGPTGSGKTTSLYSMLNELNTESKKIITVEDPVEYRISRINQVQVYPQIDLTFARALRAILRQDPDILMIGELRDQDTVSIALRAAMTGHFVLSTLHTNDAVSSIVRLIDMGAEGYLIATVLRAVIAQRLVRRICVDCIQDYQPNEYEKIWLSSIKNMDWERASFKKGAGCHYCYKTGFKGQIGVYELLELNPALENALRQNNTQEFIDIVQADMNFQPLVQYGLNLATQGITTISEIMRIIGEHVSDQFVKKTPVMESFS